MIDAREAAERVLAALDERRQIAPLTDADPAFDLPQAERAAAEVTRLRMARGERPLGWKLGFTNRTIWDEYGVRAPICGPVWDTTCAPIGTPVLLSDLVEPRIEPEIVFRLSRLPEPGMTAADCIDCVSHVSFGFEIVQSVFPGWRFRAPDTVVAFALHGALRTGPFVEVSAGERGDWTLRLADFGVALSRDGGVVDRGRSSNVLSGGPLAALACLAGLVRDDPAREVVGAGALVSTGTLTRALPVAAGETWEAVADGLGLEAPRLTLL